MIYKVNFSELHNAVFCEVVIPARRQVEIYLKRPRIQADSSIWRALARLSSVIVIPASMRATSSIRSF